MPWLLRRLDIYSLIACFKDLSCSLPIFSNSIKNIIVVSNIFITNQF